MLNGRKILFCKESGMDKITIQLNRMANIKRIISENFNDKIDLFAEFLGKSKYIIYAWLWDLDKPQRRNITTEVARSIELKLSLPTNSLDSSEEIIDNGVIDFEDLTKYQKLLQQILDMQNLLLVNHSKIKKIIK